MGSISANRTAKRHLRTCFMYMSTLFQGSVRKVPRARLFLVEKSLGRRRWRRSAGRSGRKFKGDRRVWLTIFLVPGDIFRKKERGFFFYTICSSEERILQGQEKSGRSESIGKVSFTS